MYVLEQRVMRVLVQAATGKVKDHVDDLVLRRFAREAIKRLHRDYDCRMRMHRAHRPAG